jgi:hypothetical protein
MKKSILIFTGIITLFVVILLSSFDRSQFRLGDKSYFLESGDSVICELQIVSASRIKKNGIVLTRIEVSNDSIYLEGETTYNKYKEIKKGPNKFMVTFDENGIIDTNQLRKFVNKEKKIFENYSDTFPTITKVTIK